MSAASERRARVGASIDRAFGETFSLAPRCAPDGDRNARYVSDPNRQAYDYIGRFTSASEDVHARYRATALTTTKAFNSATPTITAARSNLRGAIAERDLITREATGEIFAVSKTADGGFDRLTLHLRQAQG